MTVLRTINRDQLRKRIDSNTDFVLLETLPRTEFESGHLPGAKNLPLDRIESRASDLIPNKDTEVVVYCASSDCDASEKAARKLMSMGYTNVFDYAGGKADWEAAERTMATA